MGLNKLSTLGKVLRSEEQTVEVKEGDEGKTIFAPLF
jgi:hypothetical protein